MDPRLARVLAALPPRAVVTDPGELAPHLLDWRGHKRGVAHGLVRPASTEEVQALVIAAARDGVALVPQGGNTGLVGGSVPEPEPDRPTLLVSMTRMNRIRAVDPAGLSMVAEAGTVLTRVHEAAAAHGLAFPLSLGAKGSATIGGLCSTNAGGTQVLRHGPMRALVLGLEAVLPDGSRLDQLRPLRKDSTGYDIKQLLIGAEGTLGIITAAALKLVPAPRSRAVGWAALPSLEAALDLLARLRARVGERVESFEVMAGDGLELVVAHVPGARAPVAGRHAWHALVELADAEAGLDLERGLTEALAQAMGAGLVADATVAQSDAQAEAWWRLRETLPEAERREGPSLKNDVAVAVADVPAFDEAVRVALLGRFPGARPLVFGHLGDGNLHWNLRPPLGADPRAWLAAHGAEARRLLDDVVVRFRGTISAEHGLGTAKAAEFARVGDPGKQGAMRAIKAALDPLGIMNPGKLFPPEDGRVVARRVAG
ncbi:MAG: FAD-binding oxidoreductase [Sphingomonadaceae bacterium]|uniref:FAD-binding oxidoreductase n=1 Tax=Thermaurantiacus sp. TaxID=2820283 RepID=UPI00298EFA7F|nr:FAD-binding oxidoreductase [Thermaurantiacus sp.]MCS6987533.1 FAD-binding oxidoreductase [Sphingomonadaceae bacterium]MDW8415134.1 FAD-binding oxidoreductase [Thermaurantiacus sp.]